MNQNWVLITGASTGIGRACASHLAKRGWHVIAGVRKLAGARPEQNVEHILLDVTNPEAIDAAAKTVDGMTGGDGLRALVNNAGICIAGPVEFVPMAEWRRQFEVNFFGQIAVTQAMLPHIRRHVAGGGSGRIVNMSSITGRIAPPVLGPYAGSKFALEAISDAMRVELRTQGIQVCLVEPGAIDTPIWNKGEVEATTLYPPGSKAFELYGPALQAVADEARKSAASAISADYVAEAVEKCLTRRRPRTRYLVGRDAKIGAFFKGLLPDRWLDYGLGRSLGEGKSR